MDVDAVVERIFKLFDDYGSEAYIGEPVSQTEHMIQCAMQAEKEGYSEEVVLGALFHDIGHLIGMEQGLTRMETDGIILGAANHDTLGEKFLLDLGLPEAVYILVKELSEASKMTLVHQGGPMEAAEAAKFEASPYHDVILRMRQWDERAKVKGLKIEPMKKYEDMCRRVLVNTCKA